MRTFAEYREFLEPVLHLLAERASFRCEPGLAEVLEKHPRLVALFSHGTPLSWIPVSCLIAQECVLAGGGDRVPLGVVDEFFYRSPLFRPLAKHLSQSERPLSFDGLVESFRSRARADLVVFPEGSNCFFGDPSCVQEFRSPRALELAIRTETPILVGVHRGSEDWARTLPVNEDFVARAPLLPAPIRSRLSRAGVLTVPFLPKRMKRFRVSCELYSPRLRASDLSGDASERKAQVGMEAEAVRARMVVLLARLDEE